MLRPRRGQPIDIHPRCHRLTRPIRRVPHRRVKPRWSISIDQRHHPLPQHIKHLQPHPRRGGKLIGNDRGRIKRIGIIRPQPKALGQGRTAQRRQPQRKIARRIGRRLRHRAMLQSRHIKQQHLH